MMTTPKVGQQQCSTGPSYSLDVLERETMENRNDKYIFAMYLMFLRAPGCNTLPSECVDLGEIGQVKQKNWGLVTPYSPAEPSR